MDLVQRSWNLLVTKRGISDVEVQFVVVNRRTEFTMDMLIEGTNNIRFILRYSLKELFLDTHFNGSPALAQCFVLGVSSIQYP